MQKGWSPAEAILFGLSFAYGLIALTALIVANDTSTRVYLWIALMIGCLIPIWRTGVFRANWRVKISTLLSFIIIGELAFIQSLSTRLLIAAGIVAVSSIGRSILYAQQLRATRNAVYQEVIAIIERFADQNPANPEQDS